MPFRSADRPSSPPPVLPSGTEKSRLFSLSPLADQTALPVQRIQLIIKQAITQILSIGRRLFSALRLQRFHLLPAPLQTDPAPSSAWPQMPQCVDPFVHTILRHDQRHPIMNEADFLFGLSCQNHKYGQAILNSIQPAQPCHRTAFGLDQVFVAGFRLAIAE